ncbi:hypothetical protein ABZ345_07640 [Lentzea sp. NPDC005914]|uniref:hypothetical protein n=1 Tax=Lentzea sp. NPDC005914 TaxID=3154572 RepID=UPI0033FC8883
MSNSIQRALALALALGAVVTAAPTASAAKLKVELEVTNKAKYTASICGLDWLGGYCTYSVKPGKTAGFTVEPRSADDRIEIRVVVDKGGSEYFHTSTGKAKACFETRGTAKAPTVTQVDCA